MLKCIVEFTSLTRKFEIPLAGAYEHILFNKLIVPNKYNGYLYINIDGFNNNLNVINDKRYSIFVPLESTKGVYDLTNEYPCDFINETFPKDHNNAQINIYFTDSINNNIEETLKKFPIIFEYVLIKNTQHREQENKVEEPKQTEEKTRKSRKKN